MCKEKIKNLGSVTDTPPHSYPLLVITHMKFTSASSNLYQSHQSRNYYAYYHNHGGTTREKKNQKTVPETEMQLQNG